VRTIELDANGWETELDFLRALADALQQYSPTIVPQIDQRETFEQFLLGGLVPGLSGILYSEDLPPALVSSYTVIIRNTGNIPKSLADDISQMCLVTREEGAWRVEMAGNDIEISIIAPELQPDNPN
jgi:hypothetical protein